MKNNNKLKLKLLNVLTISGLMFLSGICSAGTVYQVEASGKNDEAALGNLKMTAPLAAHRRGSRQAVRPRHHPPGRLGGRVCAGPGYCGEEGARPVHVRDRRA